MTVSNRFILYSLTGKSLNLDDLSMTILSDLGLKSYSPISLLHAETNPKHFSD